MKINIKSLIGIVVLGLSACGDTTTPVGTGPNFTSSITAKVLWAGLSLKVNVPNKLYGGSTSAYVSGTADCTGGGSVTVEDSVSGNTESADITYKNCVDSYGFSFEGTIHLEMARAESLESEVGHYVFQQHMSVSGALGLAADCEYEVDIKNVNTAEGIEYSNADCSYRDAAEHQLTIDNKGMKDTLIEILKSQIDAG